MYTAAVTDTGSGNSLDDYYHIDDVVIISNCSDSDSLKNNGAFRISGLTSSTISLVHKDTFEAIVTGTDATDCTISKLNIVVTTNDNVWTSVNRISEASAVSPVGVGNIPLNWPFAKLKYEVSTAFLSYTLPNISSLTFETFRWNFGPMHLKLLRLVTARH